MGDRNESVGAGGDTTLMDSNDTEGRKVDGRLTVLNFKAKNGFHEFDPRVELKYFSVPDMNFPT